MAQPPPESVAERFETLRRAHGDAWLDAQNTAKRVTESPTSASLAAMADAYRAAQKQSCELVKFINNLLTGNAGELPPEIRQSLLDQRAAAEGNARGAEEIINSLPPATS